MSALTICAAIACLLLPSNAWAKSTNIEWARKLEKRLIKLDAGYSGELGVFVKIIGEDQVFSFRGDESWYLASGIKVPVAVAVLQAIDAGSFTFETKLTLTADDYVDGAGPTNWLPAGSVLSVRYLLEQMLVESDNTASDLLIGQVGLEKVNAVVATLVPGEFGPITTLADVRRLTYSAMHAKAFTLRSADLLALKLVTSDTAKVDALATVLHVDRSEFRTTDLAAAFGAYYASHFNSASLRSYAKLLEKLAGGEGLSEESRAYLFAVLARVKTGKARLQAGFPKHYVFAHKTGTQRGKICDFGIVQNTRDRQAKRVIVAACSRGDVSTQQAEKALRAVGLAITKSGVLKAGALNAAAE